VLNRPGPCSSRMAIVLLALVFVNVDVCGFFVWFLKNSFAVLGCSSV